MAQGTALFIDPGVGHMRRSLKFYLPEWAHDWLEIIVPGLQILLILLAAWLLQHLLRRLVRRAGAHYQLPADMLMLFNGVLRWPFCSAPRCWYWSAWASRPPCCGRRSRASPPSAPWPFCRLERAVQPVLRVADFAVGPFRVGDVIEVLDTADKEARGRVTDINLLYTTLEDIAPALRARCCRFRTR